MNNKKLRLTKKKRISIKKKTGGWQVKKTTLTKTTLTKTKKILSKPKIIKPKSSNTNNKVNKNK